MFWNGNYVATREISLLSLLKEENVTLTQVIEADDILQECQAENKALVKFLTTPDVLAELITLITEEPSQDVELQSQYRYSTVACEILTSGIGAVIDMLSSDATQMHRLCDFIAKEPPLNPLLASFFSKTIKALLEQSPKQDWYSYHITCLRVLDFLKSRTDFIHNLYRHIGTSAIMDTFKYLIRLDLSSKAILEWLQESDFLETTVQMICGTYSPKPLPPPAVAPASPPPPPPPPPPPLQPTQDKLNGDHVDNEKGGDEKAGDSPSPTSDEEVTEASPTKTAQSLETLMCPTEVSAASIVSGRSANAANLLCEIILVGCYGEGCSNRPVTGTVLMDLCKGEQFIILLLNSMFTSPKEVRRDALVNGVQVLLATLQEDPIVSVHENRMNREAVVATIAPRLPLLHQTLLQEPPRYQYLPKGQRIVGMARLQVATLIAALAQSPAQEVSSAILALGTLSTLLDLFFDCPGNNLFHAQTYRAMSGAITNAHQTQLYTVHLLIECDVLTRVMDAFEENEPREGGPPRNGYMGHVLLLLELFQQMFVESLLKKVGVSDELIDRWDRFQKEKMRPLFRETPLGGYHPASANYECEVIDDLGYDGISGISATAAGEQELGVDDNATDDEFYSNYHYSGTPIDEEEGGGEGGEGGGARPDPFDDDDTQDWSEFNTCRRLPFSQSAAPPSYPGVTLDAVSPWEMAPAEAETGAAGAAEGWAQFSNEEDQQRFGTTLHQRYWRMPSTTEHESNSEEALKLAMENLNVLSPDVPETSATVNDILSTITAVNSFTIDKQNPEPTDQSADSPEDPEPCQSER